MDKSGRRACTARAALSPPRGAAWRPAARCAPGELDDRVELAIWDGGVLLRAGAREIHLPWPAWDQLHDALRAGRAPQAVVERAEAEGVLLAVDGTALPLSSRQWALFGDAVRAGRYANT